MIKTIISLIFWLFCAAYFKQVGEYHPLLVVLAQILSVVYLILGILGILGIKAYEAMASQRIKKTAEFVELERFMTQYTSSYFIGTVLRFVIFWQVAMMAAAKDLSVFFVFCVTPLIIYSIMVTRVTEKEKAKKS